MIHVLDKLFKVVLEKLVDEGIKEIVATLGVNREMEALQTKVKNINCMLDLQNKQIKGNSIALGVAELREVLYDTEDLLDAFAAARRSKSKSATDILRYIPGVSQISKIFYVIFEKRKISTKIKNINSNLKRIISQEWIQEIVKNQPNADNKVSSLMKSLQLLECSFQLDSEIVGIDDDVTDLVDRIKGDCEDHSLFAISGMCGIGKTTLARKVFNHDLIQNHFDNTVWVCVSSNCTDEYLLNEIVRCFDNNYSESFVSANELSCKLFEVVKEKRVFIVLDDIWDAHVWEYLRVPLRAGAKYTRILITTRNEHVAKEMNAGHTHRMTEMNLSDGWSMLYKIVFNGKDTVDVNKLEKVGKKIVDRCKGLPLAINVVGRDLRMKNNTIAAWTRVLSSRSWSVQDLPEDILASLLLSYEDLPFHLKQCFIYCSLFPQDFTFHPTKLMYMWIAEGFIHKKEETRMEESAKEYYNELVMRNLLQVTVLDRDGSSTCKMHDLIHSLAIFVSQNQYIYVDPKTFAGSGLFRHRHLRFNVENENVVSKEIIGKEYVRTLMLSKIYTFPDQVLSGLTRLRVLDLECIKIERLPEDSVGEMRQLRFLSISARELHMLPDSIENLENLETLMISSVLESCQKGSPDSIENHENLETLMISSVLKSRSLPKGICKLHNLRHLLVSERLQNMPNGLDNLKKLRVLDCFVVNECTSSTIVHWPWKNYKSNMKELKDLSQLTDLSIHNLERVASEEEAKEAAIEKKTSLKCLTLSCEPPPRISDEDIRKIEEVFKGIKIPENLTELSIDGFFGKQLPDHMTSNHLREVKSLELKNCKSLEQLPSLGDMPKLETLHMANLSVVNFGSDFVGRLKFPKLQDFRLMEMEELVDMFEVEKGDFPCLVNLFISGCPNLKSLGEGLQRATCLKKMTVESVLELESIENLSSISELEISWNRRLKSVKNLPSLKKMDINDCSALEVVQHVPKLSSLSISSDPEMNTLPVWLKNTITSEKWHWTVTDSEELVLMSRSKRVEVKINGVKVNSNFPGASEIGHPTDSEEFFDAVNDIMDVDNSRYNSFLETLWNRLTTLWM